MESLPLPMDIINKIQLYVSTPEADMVRDNGVYELVLVCPDDDGNNHPKKYKYSTQRKAQCAFNELIESERDKIVGLYLWLLLDGYIMLEIENYGEPWMDVDCEPHILDMEEEFFQ
jgi:hypothetical protein